MDNTVYREVSFNDNFDCVADYNGEPIYLKKVEADQQELWEELVKYLNHYNSQNNSGQMYFPMLDLKSKYTLIPNNL